MSSKFGILGLSSLYLSLDINRNIHPIIWAMSKTEDIDLAAVMKLSVIELYILNYLVRIAGSVVRFTVFNEIHDELGFETMSRSSFYNSLENLEREGFIEIDAGESGKTKSVRALPLAKKAITQVNIFNLWGSIDPDEKFSDLILKNSELFENKKKKLIVSFQYPASKQMVSLMGGEFTYLLGTEATIGPIAEDYELVSIDDNYIDKRKDFFDTTIIYRYAYNKFRYESNLNFPLLIEECIRVTKPGGAVILLALDHIRGSNNLILESGIGSFLQDTLSSQSPSEVLRIIDNDLPIETKSKVITVEEVKSNDLSMIVIKL